jgi:alanyl-tRNA synthetase
MVHKAIREALGETATQAGSENSPGRFRFDFHAASAIPASALRDIDPRVNVLLAEDLEVHAEIMTQEQARAAGAMALFGEKYGDRVRVISVGDWARELCGGTHALRSGQLGMVKLLGEGSIGSGLRRVEALVGADAYQFAAREHVLLSQLTDALKVRPEDLPERVSALVTQLRDAQKEIEKFRSGQVLAVAGTLAQTPKDVFGVSVVVHDAGEAGADDLRTLVLDIRGRLGADRPVVVAAGGLAKGRPIVVVATNDEARRWGVAAGDLVREAARVLGGGGGGKPDVAQGGGSDPDKLPDALRQVEYAVGQRVTSGH